MIGDDENMRWGIAEAGAEMEVAQLVYDVRTKAGLTQKELADRIGTTQSVISRLEDSDYHGHSLALLGRICRALNMTLVLQMKPNKKPPTIR